MGGRRKDERILCVLSLWNIPHFDSIYFQILAIFAATSFGYVAGIYGLIVYSQGLSEDGGFAKMAAAYSIENIYGGVRLLLILFVTQYLMNSVRCLSCINFSFHSKKVM